MLPQRAAGMKARIILGGWVVAGQRPPSKSADINIGGRSLSAGSSKKSSRALLYFMSLGW